VVNIYAAKFSTKLCIMLLVYFYVCVYVFFYDQYCQSGVLDTCGREERYKVVQI